MNAHVNEKLMFHRSLYIIWLVSIGVAFLASRLYHLTILPMFVDESIHIHWVVEIAESGDWLVTDGTRLLPIWVLRLLLPAVSDILWSGRLVSVLMGLLAAVGCYLVGQSLFNCRTGAVAFTLYVVNPFTLSNDRLMLSDVYLVAWTVLTAWLSIKIVKTQHRWWWSVALGLVLGLAALSKLSGVLVWGLPLLVFFLLGQDPPRKFPKGGLVLTYGVAALVSSPVCRLLLRTGLDEALDMSLVESSTSSWVTRLWENMGLLISWLWAYLTPGIGIAFVVAILFTLWKQPRYGMLLVGWVSIFTVPWIVIADSWFPRYILPAFPALFVLLGSMLDSFLRWMAQLPVKKRLIGLSLGLTGIIFLVWPAIYFDYWQLHNPELAPFPAIDRFQYIEGWSSGYGVSDVIECLRAQADDKGDIFVVMDDDVLMLTGGLAFDVWRKQEKSIHVLQVDVQKLSAEDIYEQVSTSPLPVYWVVGDRYGPDTLDQEMLTLVRIKQIAGFARPGNKSHLYMYFISAGDDL